MQKIFIEKPYRFTKPIMAEWLPRLMNNRLIHTPMLRFTESIVAVESRGFDRLKGSVKEGHGVMMIGNHPRISDPVVIFDLLRRADTTMFAMASWHLFNQSRFVSSVLWLYGGFSVNREGLDRESINFAISALQNNTRPVLMFPEGATSRTNDAFMPWLEGPSFIARTAARRRSKQGLKTVIHPIAFRYLFVGDFAEELERLMQPVEEILGLPDASLSPADRVERALAGLVARKESEFEFAGDESLDVYDRCQRLAATVMVQAEQRCFGKVSDQNITSRIRDVRTFVFPQLLADQSLSPEDHAIRWRDLERTYLAWQMATYPKDYLANGPSEDRILEIAAKVLEDLTDKPRKCGKQKVIIECCEPIEVPAKKHRGETPDPLQEQIESALRETLEKSSSSGVTLPSK